MFHPILASFSWKTQINTDAREATNKSPPLIKSCRVCQVNSDPIILFDWWRWLEKLLGTQKPWSWYNNIDLLVEKPAFYLPRTQWVTKHLTVHNCIRSSQRCSEAGGGSYFMSVARRLIISEVKIHCLKPHRCMSLLCLKSFQWLPAAYKIKPKLLM